MTRATMLRSLRPGARVECNVRGRIFWATLVAPVDAHEWRVDPPAGISYYHVTTRQIINVDRGWTPDDTQHRTQST